MAMATTAGVFVIMFCMFAHRWIVAAVLLVFSVVGTGYLAVDPGLRLAGRVSEVVASYATRGESKELLLSLTGRTELWMAITQSFFESPLVGHGYFVTSRTGAFDVWQGESNHSAHNLLLQVLVSTGLVGCTIFLGAMAGPMWLVARGLSGEGPQRQLAVFCILLAIWYFGWSLLCESFMGPIQPESVVFFTVLGLAVGNLTFSDRLPVRSKPQQQPVDRMVTP
jgi:O-antigen ligase